MIKIDIFPGSVVVARLVVGGSNPSLGAIFSQRTLMAER
jgi:hypothetical protein